MTVLITTEHLDERALAAAMPAHDGCGARVTFVGVVRNEQAGRAVRSLDYECFIPMAEAELTRILAEATARWPIHDVALAHRIGSLTVGEASLWLCVVAPHRAEAFAAMQYIIDELKHRVPIWKKEQYADGRTAWVGCRHG